MSSLKERLKELRKENNLTQADMAERLRKEYNLKTDRVMISKWETGFQTPEIYTISCIADMFGVSLDYLNGKSSNLMFDDLAKFGIKPITQKKFRMLGKIACGEPIYANEDYETYIEASADINADFCLTAQGDSMINARIFDGDIVFIKAQSDVDNGEIAAVIIGDEVTLKRVYKYNNRLELRAENPTYEPLNYEGYELENIRILGKAVAFQSYVK